MIELDVILTNLIIITLVVLITPSRSWVGGRGGGGWVPASTLNIYISKTNIVLARKFYDFPKNVVT